MNNYLIYKHTSPSGKSYIGQTKNYHKRTNQHKNPNNKSCQYFRNAIQKYTWEAFTHEILAENLSKNKANELEQTYIQEHNTLYPFGYNLTTGGEVYICLEITKQKISISKKGKCRPPRTAEHCSNISKSKKGKSNIKRVGISCSMDTKLKISKANLGKRRTEEEKQKISKGHIGIPSSKKGIPISENQKLKISLSNKGKPSPIKGKKLKIDPITGKRSYYYPSENN